MFRCRRAAVLAALVVVPLVLGTMDAAELSPRLQPQAAAPSAVVPASTASLSDEAIERFLMEAKVTKTKGTSKGVTNSVRATLSDGTLVHDAHIQNVDEYKREFRTAMGVEFDFRDSWSFNVAAYKLDRILGLNLVPVAVKNRYRANPAAFSWWVDDVMMDEAEREKKSAQPPDGGGLPMVRQRQLMQVFAELVYDTDRNKGNVVYTNDWQLVMLDFTRAFRTHSTLRTPQAMGMIDRKLLARLRNLTKQQVSKAVGTQLTAPEIDAMMQRRDLIVEHFDQLVKQRGENAVLFGA